jgi:hypothetical protein
MRQRILWVSLGIVLCVAPLVLAQDCPPLIESALASVADACQDINRNEVCYGNTQLAATARDGAPEFVFERTGDLARLQDIQSLQLTQDLAAEQWGVALIRAQANLPDTLPGQNVTFVLFGDVELRDESPRSIFLQTSIVADFRTAPQVASNTLLTQVPPATPVTAYGRDESARWVRVEINGAKGWMQRDFLTSPAESFNILYARIEQLPIIEQSTAPISRPLQAFYFRSGIGDSPCQQAPSSGMLIQAPEGFGTITLTINGIEVALASTVYVRSAENNGSPTLNITMLKGRGVVSVNGETLGDATQATQAQFLPSGTTISIPLIDDCVCNLPTAGPSGAQPYDQADLMTLNSLAALLPDDVEVSAPPLNLVEGSTEVIDDKPSFEGQYRLVATQSSETCLAETADTMRPLLIQNIRYGDTETQTNGLLNTTTLSYELDEATSTYGAMINSNTSETVTVQNQVSLRFIKTLTQRDGAVCERTADYVWLPDGQTEIGIPGVVGGGLDGSTGINTGGAGAGGGVESGAGGGAVDGGTGAPIDCNDPNNENLPECDD